MPDFGFVGPSYEAPSIYQEAQECINFYPEIDPLKAEGSRGVVALYPTPGLVLAHQLDVATVRGMRALSGGQYLMCVVGNKVYVINNNDESTLVGSLSTFNGSVSISDNITSANGLTAYIVDGTARYTWVAFNSTFTQLSGNDGPWFGATVVDVVDSYNIYNEPGTQNWAATDLDSTASTNAYYGTKNGAPDPIVSLIADHRQVYLLGQQTTEVWVDVGNVIPNIISFPFQRVAGTMMQHGCAAAFSIARFSEQFVFVSRDNRGQAMIGAIENYSFRRLSTHAVENTLLNQDVSDAVAYTYQYEGHEFYVVTFPSIDLTWVYDLASGMWHKWLSTDSFGIYHRHRSNCGAFFNNKYYVGDYENGKIYTLDNSVYTEDGATIRRLRRAPHLVTDFQRQYFAELQIQFQPGVGTTGVSRPLGRYISSPYVIGFNSTLTVGAEEVVILGGSAETDPSVTTTNPKAMLRWSNDGGSTWSSEHWTSIGQLGRYQNRAIWRRLGQARDRIFEVSISDPVKAVIVSANLKSEGADN